MMKYVKDKYLNIGYPLGYILENNETKYILDIGNTYQYLSQNEFEIWSSMSSQNGDLEILLKKKCILNLKNDIDMELFWGGTMLRQGIGSIYQNKHSINLGAFPIHITETQMQIWRKANGKIPLKELRDKINIM